MQTSDTIKKITNTLMDLPTCSFEFLKGCDTNTLKASKDRSVKKLKNAIKKHGFNFPFFIWDNYIVDGAGRLLALQELESEGYEIPGLPYINVHAASLAEAKKLVLQVSSQHGVITQNSFDEFVTGLDLSDILDAIELPNIELDIQTNLLDPEADPDEVPDVTTPEPITKPGDVYEIGPHRLLCGDSTTLANFELLLAGHKADMVWTDPPYNVDYSAKSEFLKQYRPCSRDNSDIANDAMGDKEFYTFLQSVFANLALSSQPGGAIYIAHADSEGINFRTAMIDAGWDFKQCLIWVKNHMVLGRQDYQWKHEPILYGWLPGAAHKWFGERNKTTVLEFDKPQRSGEHPTMKPVELVQFCIENSSTPSEIVLDAFGGSGTTMVACQMAGRVARLVELDPHYCDVIVERMRKLFPDLSIRRNGQEV